MKLKKQQKQKENRLLKSQQGQKRKHGEMETMNKPSKTVKQVADQSDTSESKKIKLSKLLKQERKITEERNEEEVNKHVNAYKEKLFGKTNKVNSSTSSNTFDDSNPKDRNEKKKNRKAETTNINLNLESSVTAKDLRTRWFEM